MSPRRPHRLALAAGALCALLGVLSCILPADPVTADSTSPDTDENRDEATPSPLPPRPASEPQSAGVTPMRVGSPLIDDFVYDELILEGTAAEVCAGRIRPGTLDAFWAVVDRFGGSAGTMYACRERWDAANDPDCNGTVVNPATNPNFTSTCWSNHALGRAFDVMVGKLSNGAYNRTRGLNIVNWLLAGDSSGNLSVNARRLGVQQILFDDRCWNSAGDRGISSWSQMRECDVGHHDHVHVDMTNRGAAGQTSWWGYAPIVQPKPDTQVFWDRQANWRQAVSWWNLREQDEEGTASGLAGFDRTVTGDWGGDGWIDEILVWDVNTGGYVIQNWVAGDGVNAVTGRVSTIYDDMVAGDWDRDGRLDDAMWWDHTSGRWVVQSFTGFRVTRQFSGTMSTIYDVGYAGDFNGDGFLSEIMFWDRETGQWAIAEFWSDGRMAVRNSGHWARTYDVVLVGDWDSQGDLDETITWDRETGQWAIHEWTGYRSAFRGNGSWPSNVRIAAPGDFDTDGRMDDVFLYVPGSGAWRIDSFHRLVNTRRRTGTILAGYDMISVGAFSS